MNTTPRNRSATLYDICARTGMSSATVSRVINDSPKVSAATRAKVEQAIAELGYVPSHAARMLARRRTGTLGVIFPDLDGGFFTEVLRGIDEVAARHDLHLFTAFSHGRRDERELLDRFVREGRADALILMNLLTPDEAVMAASKGGTPVVLLDRPVAGSGLPAITMDNAGGAAAMMEHLIGHGHERIALITGPEDNYDAQERLAGARRAARRARLALPAEMVWRGQFTEASGRDAVDRWLSKNDAPPDAIFAFNDAMAIGALESLRRHGASVPEDVAVVGFDDIHAARHLGLTTVRAPMRDMGRAAATAAVARIEGADDTGEHRFPTDLIVRRSCGCEGT